MKIKWNGHASFTILSDTGAVVVTDPYEPGGYQGAIKYGPITDEADVVTVSHEHADHNHVDGVPGNPEVVKSSGKAAGIEFKAVPTYHDEKKGADRGGNNIFVFSIDGVVLCHLGDLGHGLSEETLRQIGKVDVLFLPIGGTFTIDPNQATTAMRVLDPKIVAPMHFKTEKCGFPIAKLDDFLHGKEEKVKRVGNSWVELSAGSLPDPREIWVFDHAC